MSRFNSATLFAAAAAAAAEIYRKMPLRSVPISRRSLSSAGGFGMSRKPYLTKKRPPLPALWNVGELTCESAARGGVCHVYLIGTWHRSQRSKEEVKAMIESMKPEVVFLELCPARAYQLEPQNAKEGGEFYVANEEAMKYGAKVILGDRHCYITMDRSPIMANLLERLMRPLSTSYIRFIEIMIKKYYEKDERGATLLREDEMYRISPSSYGTVVNERDQYMSATLLEVARQHSSVVAVVGASHLPGIQKYWKKPVDMKQLLHAPTRTRRVTRLRRILIDLLLFKC